MNYNKHHHIKHTTLRFFRYFAILFVVSMTSLAGCKKFVEAEPPKSQLLGEQIFEEASTAVAALAGVYVQMRDNDNGMLCGQSWGMPIYMAQYADELINYSNRGQNYGENFFKNVLFVDSEDIYSLWNVAYNQIYNVNAIIEGVEKSVKLTDSEKLQLKGEALFIRALLHFYLLNLYGDVPYVSSTDYLVNRNLSRLPTETVYEHILTDLKNAEAFLGENYPSAERVRPNKYVVRALMARVYLYKKDWLNAEAMATAVIDHNSTYQLSSNLGDVFLKGSAGTIWAFKPNLEGSNTDEGFTNILLYSPVPYSRSISPSLLDAFEPGDQRRDEWIGSYSEGSDTWYFPYKYKQRGNTGTGINREYPVILRLEEQYLIRAEARAQQENIGGAQQDINMIRNRAGLLDTQASTKTALLEAVLHERQVELFTEYGHRWFDLKRMGKSDEVLSVVKPNWNSEDKLLPIPEKELLVNPNLNPQNPGY